MSVFESENSTFQLETQEQRYLQEEAARQNSILSLTLDEIQMKSGKSLGAMNMDEFLANLWTSVEENDNNNNDGEKPSVMPRQGSLSVPVPLCKKTVDEVWFEIQNGVHQPPTDEDIRRQQTLGEITLEDFLVKAGVVQEPLKTSTSMRMDFGYNHHSFYSVVGESSTCMTANERGNQFLTGFDAFRIKKRIIDGPPEILMERRQRRMIKNRESAARSRARRQAYTVELEYELNHLTEENIKLKELVEGNAKRRRQEILNRSKQLSKEKNGDKLRRIRRMASAGW